MNEWQIGVFVAFLLVAGIIVRKLVSTVFSIGLIIAAAVAFFLFSGQSLPIKF